MDSSQSILKYLHAMMQLYFIDTYTTYFTIDMIENEASIYSNETTEYNV